jgi:hypothetical protein
MVAAIVSIIAILAVGLVLVLRGPATYVGQSRTARWLAVVALVPLGLQVAVYLVFGIGEMASGDWSGAGHLVPAIATGVLGFLCWKRPLEGGVALLLVGVITLLLTSGGAAILIVAAPMLLSGALFLASGLVARAQAAS